MENLKRNVFSNGLVIALLLFGNLFFAGSLNIESQKNLRNKNSERVFEISNYHYPRTKEEDSVTIAILGTNDIHGQAFEKADIPFDSEKVSVGGYKLLSGLIDIIREQYGKNSLWLDAGDQFTGTYEKELTKGKLMIDFYNTMKVDAVAIGNHEWDKKEPQLRDWMSSELGSLFNGKDNNWSYENYGKFLKNLYLDANLKPKEGNSDYLPNQMPSRIFEFENGNIKIGVIGLTTLETVSKTQGFSKNTFEILAYKEVVEETSKYLRNQGAHAVLVLSHVGMNCKPDHFTENQVNELYELKLRYSSYSADGRCTGEIMNMLNEIDPNIIDGVIAGHIHDSVHHFVNGVPVIQNPINNIFANVLYLKFEKKGGIYKLKRQETLIEGPIPLCSKVYTNNKRCDIFQEINSYVSFRDFTFHGKKIQPNKNVVDLFENKYAEVNKKIEEYKNTFICKTEVLLERKLTQENALGNLVADFIRKTTNSDVSMISPGALRYTWDKGYITKYSMFNMFPFGGKLSSYKVKGKDLKKIIVTLQQEGKLGYLYSFSGIKMTLIKQSNKRMLLDMDSLILDNGEKIDDEKEYSFGANEFFLTGGDDMTYVINQITPGPLENRYEIIESYEKELTNIKVITQKMYDSLLGRITIK
jgi:2',3'-cyclic-nucleotide 2'-phosphodiesterase (5'-nucleotidase family)